MINITEEEFRHIFRKLYADLVNYALSLDNQEEVKDIVQEAFMELWRRRDTMTDPDHVKAFLYRTVYNRILNLVRHRNIVQGYSEQRRLLELRKLEYFQPERSDVMRAVESKELGRMIDSAIDELPEKCRMAFKLSYLHGMKNKEISDVMKISVRTVDTHIFKALRYLRDRLAFLNRE